ncbi:sugar transferase [Patescibacteria group bacterium]|nr:sugar transferase [Patescibacteria group bacterium]MBU1663240.1 sugar transferase [Patescibacteria group bacterium]MBU2007697.1 sugar transferase [Patescibacteria group bacterium]MBU2233661.1 sugar transferase [Patescibacteria group bacterium]MBU2264340.1 sugar transferase [Patescibacteria group bacterium]
MKKSELFFSFLLVPLDFLMIILAGISAYNLRFAGVATEIRPVIFSLPFSDYFQILLLIALAWLIIFALAGLYNIKGSRRLTEEVYQVILACSTGLMLIVIIIFAFRELFSSRFIVLAGWLLAIVYISFARIIIRSVQRTLLRYGIGIHNIVLVGDSNTTDALIYEFSSRKNSGYEVVKRLKNFNMEAEEDLAEFIKICQVDEIMQSDPNLSKAEVIRLFDFADENHIIFKYAADLLGAKVLKTEVSEIAGIPVVEVKKTPLEGWGRIIKRIFDVVGSTTLFIIFSPILIFTILAIKLDSHGSIFYLDYRSGQHGRKFLFYKFRSMLAHLCDGEGPGATTEGNKMLEKLIVDEKYNTRQAGPLHKIKDDPRITRVGKFIRRWSIDELPQLVNVFKGDISLVGPRCHMTMETARYESRHKKVLSIKPGITGLAQISGRSDLSFEDEVKLDSYYIENWSLLLDIGILVRTPLAIIKGRKVE